MMENKSTTEEVYSPLALLDQDKIKNFREAEGEQSVPHDPAHEIPNSVDETTYNRRKSSSQDASTPRTPISGSNHGVGLNRERTESHFSRATKTTTFGVLSSVVPASLVVSLMVSMPPYQLCILSYYLIVDSCLKYVHYETNKAF